MFFLTGEKPLINLILFDYTVIKLIKRKHSMMRAPMLKRYGKNMAEVLKTADEINE